MLDFGRVSDEEMQRHIDMINAKNKEARKKSPTRKEKIVQFFYVKRQKFKKLLSNQLAWKVAFFMLAVISMLLQLYSTLYSQ